MNDLWTRILLIGSGAAAGAASLAALTGAPTVVVNTLLGLAVVSLIESCALAVQVR